MTFYILRIGSFSQTLGAHNTHFCVPGHIAGTSVPYGHNSSLSGNPIISKPCQKF